MTWESVVNSVLHDFHLFSGFNTYFHLPEHASKWNGESKLPLVCGWMCKHVHVYGAMDCGPITGVLLYGILFGAKKNKNFLY